MYKDLKPDNILVFKDGYIQLADFGISEAFNDDNYRSKSTGGTMAYLAPEMIFYNSKENGYSKECDFWMLGVLLLELLTG